MIINITKELRFVNVGESPMRPKPGWVGRRQWDACMEYGFISAGQDLKYSKPLRNLEEGDIVAAYIKERGYVGLGIVAELAVAIKDFKFGTKTFKDLTIEREFIQGILTNKEQVPELKYVRKTLFCNADNNKTEFAVRIKWLKTVNKEKAFWERNAGLYAKPHIQCSLKGQPITIKFLMEKFGITFI